MNVLGILLLSFIFHFMFSYIDEISTRGLPMVRYNKVDMWYHLIIHPFFFFFFFFFFSFFYFC